ncbi:MAG TPA: MBL fold metallo-hydrolase [Oscillospiraceae bacterium]|nr:MBL fold metallo-hydrolase [Oscillospiraceae bacterium]
MMVNCIELGEYQANCYILCDKETGEGAVVDPGGFNNELLSLINKSGVKNLKYILLTHGHFDHILGTNLLKEHFPNALTAISSPDKICLKSVEHNLLGEKYADVFEEIKADVILKDNDLIKIGESTLKVLETPGHSKGSVCFISEDDEFVITGDTLFYLTVGRTDLDGGDYEQLSSSIDKLMLLDDSFVVYPGHNKGTTIGSERKRNRFLRHRDFHKR